MKAAAPGAWLTACLALLPIAHAQPLQQAVSRVEVGKTTRVGLINPIDFKTCKRRDEEIGRLSHEPRNGRAEIRRESVTLHSKECGSPTLQGYAIYYQREPAFVGLDLLGFELRHEERNTTDIYFFSVEVR